MSKHVKGPTPRTGDFSWAARVSIGLWLFTAWQLSLLPSMSAAFKSFGIESPRSAILLSGIPAWMPLAIGVPMTVAFIGLQSRKLRTGKVALALVSALCAHRANAALELKLFKVSRTTPVAIK